METREEMIMRRVKEHYDELVSLGYNVFAVILQGSQNYDLDEYSEDYMSDVDTKAIIIPKFKDLISGKAPYSHTHVRANNEHIDIKDIREMFKMFEKQNISYLELLVSKFYIVNEKYKEAFEELKQYTERIARMNPTAFLNALCGSAHNKFMAMTHVAPHSEEKIAKFGYDPKELHHLLRYLRIELAYIEGKALEDCIKLDDAGKQSLMLIKKGVVYKKNEAIMAGSQADTSMKKLKDAVLLNKNYGKVDCEMIEILSLMCCEILTKAVKEELLDEKNA